MLLHSLCDRCPCTRESQAWWARGTNCLGPGAVPAAPQFPVSPTEMHTCCFLCLTSAALRLWLRKSWAGGVLGNNHWNVHPQGSSCSWPCSALNCLKTACYNIRCSLSADHYTRSKSLRCPKTELTRSKLILKNINPKTDLRRELALWELLKTYYTNLISNKQQHSRSLGFSGHLKVYHLTTFVSDSRQSTLSQIPT